MQWSSWSKHVFERDDSHAISCAISRQEKGGLHKCIARFITYSSPGRADTWFPSLPRKECTGVRYVRTKFSRMDGLPNFVAHGAPLARFARRSSAQIFTRHYLLSFQYPKPLVRITNKLVLTEIQLVLSIGWDFAFIARVHCSLILSGLSSSGSVVNKIITRF